MFNRDYTEAELKTLMGLDYFPDVVASDFCLSLDIHRAVRGEEQCLSELEAWNIVLSSYKNNRYGSDHYIDYVLPTMKDYEV